MLKTDTIHTKWQENKIKVNEYLKIRLAGVITIDGCNAIFSAECW